MKFADFAVDAADLGLLDYSKCYTALATRLSALCNSSATVIFAVAPPAGHLITRALTTPILKASVLHTSIAKEWLSGEPFVKNVDSLPSQYFDMDALGRIGAQYVAGGCVPLQVSLALESPSLGQFNSQSTQPLAVVISTFSTRKRADAFVSDLRRLSRLLTTILVTSSQSTERLVRSQVISRTISKQDLNSILHAILLMARDLFPFEGGSIFLWDTQRKLLNLRATTGLTNPRRRHDVYYIRGENRITAQVAETGAPSVTDNIARDHVRPGKFEETVSNARISFLAVPIPDVSQMATREPRMPLGVLRLVNKTDTAGLRSEPVPFAWDDQAAFEFIAELVGVISNYLWKAVEAQDHFERVVHGIKANIGAVVLNMGHFQGHPDLVEIKNPRFKYVLLDSLALIRDIHWQVERNVDWYRPSFDMEKQPIRAGLSEVKVLGDVLAKIKGMILEMANVNNSGSVSAEYSNYDEFTKLPPVVGSVNSLITVFRNLVENALKYTKPKAQENTILFGYRLVPGFLEITVDDNGIGIPPQEEEWIFVDGFRCDNAMRRRPGGGSGIGLPQSRQLMREMGGDLYYERHEKKDTRFVVKLQLK